ncbi:hypothetical protein [Nocardia brasiliensis]|uniref:hypothetical protein n=1 Tax=Nocardia brasiliensis TaxID=37326 RepID=UPI003D8D5C41
MVRRAALVGVIATAVVAFTPMSGAHAQPSSPPPSPSSSPSTPVPLPAPGGVAPPSSPFDTCRDLGDVPGGFGEALELGCKAVVTGQHPGAVVQEALQGVVGEAAKAFADAWGRSIAYMFSWWYRTPLTGSTASDSTADIVGKTHAYLRYFQIAAFIISIGVAAVKLAWSSAQQRGQQAQEAATLAARAVFVSSVMTGMVVVADSAMRSAGVWLLEAIAGENAEQAAGKLVDVNALSPVLGSGLLFVFALLGTIGTVVQMVFILIQIAVSKLVLGTLPLVAAFSGTEAGLAAYRKLVAWTGVFLLFPFVSALVYGVAFALAAGAQDGQGTLAGMILLTLSCLTLPALVRLLVPTAGQMAGGSGAALLGGLMLASGAAPLMMGGREPLSGGTDQPATTGGLSGEQAPSGAVSAGSSSRPGTSPPPEPARGGAPGAASTPATSGSSSVGASTVAGAGQAAAGAAGPMGAVAARLGETAAAAKALAADGAQRATGSPDVPPAQGPSGSAPPTGGRSGETS